MKVIQVLWSFMGAANLLCINSVAEAYPLTQGVANSSHWITVWTAMPQLTEPANLPSGIFVSIARAI